MKLLDSISFPSDIKKLKIEQLPKLCEELREFVIKETALNPGHLGASLGTVELAVALHYVYDTPEDKIVWDVGHQAYTHKIITGRKDKFNTNRKFKGISGFPKISESEYDSFGTGHSSTSISAALGMAIAAKMQNNNARNHVAVIGDGSMGGGMAFEAMNHSGCSDVNLLIILNDNKIAIDKSVGAISQYLLSITSSPSYNRFKNKLWNFLTDNAKSGNWFTKLISSLGNVVKGLLLSGSNIFQSMGFRYFGPTDGHNVVRLVEVLTSLKKIPAPKLLHILTVKGKGLPLAEQNQITYHAPGKYDPDTGELILNDENYLKFQDVFGQTILELAEKDEKVVAITPAMLSGSSLTTMKEKYPDRVFDVGIAEQHAVTFSAALAKEGFTPFCCIYSSFLQRAYDQIIHDVALQNLPVIFAVDRAGLVGEDGATHHGLFDLAFMRPIPNMIISAPIDATEFRNLLYTAYINKKAPFAIRYPKGKCYIIDDFNKPLQKLDIGKAKLIKDGKKIAVLSFGAIGNNVLKAIENIENIDNNIAIVNMRFLKPLDEELLISLSERCLTWLTVEDGIEKGGLFSEISEFIQKRNLRVNIIPVAVKDSFSEHGDVTLLQKQEQIDIDTISDLLNNLLKN